MNCVRNFVKRVILKTYKTYLYYSKAVTSKWMLDPIAFYLIMLISFKEPTNFWLMFKVYSTTVVSIHLSLAFFRSLRSAAKEIDKME